jgi:predicted secreted protein
VVRSRLRSCLGFAALAIIACPSACHDGAPPSASTGAGVPNASNGSAPTPTPDTNDAAGSSRTGTTDGAGDVTTVTAVTTSVDPSPDGGAAGRVVVHADDDGKTFDLAVGSRIVFALANHSGTGFLWMPTHVDESVLAPDGMRRSEVESDVPGAPTRDVLRFIAKKSGTTVVEMTLKRPFGNAPPGPAIHVTVRIR